jgi:hypothetical protein
MIISFSLKGLGPPTIGLRRLFIAAAGVAALVVAVYRAPVWLDAWHTAAVVCAIAASAIALVVAIVVALAGRARAVKRVAKEISLFGIALVAAEAILLLRAPEKWADDPLAQRLSFTSAPRATRGSTTTRGCLPRLSPTFGRRVWMQFQAFRKA